MKYILPLLATSYLMVASLHAQTSPSPDPASAPTEAGSTTPRPPKHPDFISQLPDLTDDQKAKIANIKATVTDKKDQHTQIMALLTDEQKAELKKLRADWAAAHPKPTKAPASTPAPASTTPPPAAP
jgi:Spy/CpxP family protein refolding chaperone